MPAINGSAIGAYQPIARAALDRGWEFIGHGYTQKNMQKVDDERADIARTRQAIADLPAERHVAGLAPG